MGRWNKSQRMQMKAFICVLGGLLVLILLAGRLFLALRQQKPREEKEVPAPVLEALTNVWIMEADSEKLLVFTDGAERILYFAGRSDAGEEAVSLPQREEVREQIADIMLTDGRVSSIEVKAEKVNARILSADAESVELEGYGRLSLAGDYKGYRIFNTLEMCTVADLPFGYSFADFVLEDGKICAVLLAREEAMEYIRVLLKASDYSGLLHEEIVLTSDCDFSIQYGSYDSLQTESHAAGEEIRIDGESMYFAGDRVCILPGAITGKIFLRSVNRKQGNPGYRGHIELVRSEDGIAVINEVNLEEYLYSVVPSEMPASYPKEALAAQAICARTYAYGHMLHAGYPQYGAHVDDSSSYQVYNNILEQESTTTAVKETYGQLLYTESGALAGTYYYSTSCGVGTDANVWKTEAAKSITYLQAKPLNRESMEQFAADGDMEEAKTFGRKLMEEAAFAEYITNASETDFEAEEGWYRWSYQVEKIDRERMLEILKKRYYANEKLVLTLEAEEYVSKPVEELEVIKGLYIAKRGVGGIADELVIETEEHIYKVISEHNIRYVLNDGESKIHRQNGSKIESPNLLPSGFFILEPEEKKGEIVGYTLTGGGFGHGVGMSQNGAKSMAKSGYNAEQILLFFYENCYVESVYERKN